MSPPIRDGSGNSIGSIRLGDGSEISEVRTGAGDVLFSGGIPDSVVNRLPMDEGSGSILNESVGNEDASMNFSTWRNDPEYKGGTAPDADGSNDNATWTPRSQAPITITCRTELDSDGAIWGFGVDPQIQISGGVWEAFDVNNNTVSVSDGSATSAIRIVAFRLDSNNMSIDVYEDDASTKVGSGTLINPSTSFQSSTMYIWDRNSSAFPIAGAIDLMDVHDTFVSDIDTLVSDVYS